MDQYRKTPRANFLNYDNGLYFITICTNNHIHYFGEIVAGEMILNELGVFLDHQLANAHKMTEGVEVPLYVVMPNHLHAIVHIMNDCEENAGQRSPNPSFRTNPNVQRHTPKLSKYVSSLKGAVTKFANRNGIEFGWQIRYHDHLIRRFSDGNKISEYILNNVARWHTDCFYN